MVALLSSVGALLSMHPQTQVHIEIGLLASDLQVANKVLKAGNEERIKEEARKQGFDVSGGAHLLLVQKSLAEAEGDWAVSLISQLAGKGKSSVHLFNDLNATEQKAVAHIIRNGPMNTKGGYGPVGEDLLRNPAFKVQVSQVFHAEIEVDGKTMHFMSRNINNPEEQPDLNTPRVRTISNGAKTKDGDLARLVEKQEAREEEGAKRPYYMLFAGFATQTSTKAKLSALLSQRLLELSRESEAKLRSNLAKLLKANNKRAFGKEEDPQTGDELSAELQAKLRFLLRGTAFEAKPMSEIKFRVARTAIHMAVGIENVQGLKGTVGFPLELGRG